MPEVIGAIRDRWVEFGGDAGLLGSPLDIERATFDGVGRAQEFSGGTISWHPEHGAFAVWGLIRERWIATGREGSLGYPITDESGCPDGVGRFNHFRQLHFEGHPETSIYWTPVTGAHEVYGDIRNHWAGLGWETGALGYPLEEERPTFDGVGRAQEFSGGTISWHPEHGAFAVWGLIREQWIATGRESSLGYPITDESACPDGVGRFNHFRQLHIAGHPETSIYWTPATGAHEVYGEIRNRWAGLGWETSRLGYPLEAEHDRAGAAGREQRFAHGLMIWTPENGAWVDGLVFEKRIITGGLAALGGWIRVTINGDGSVRWQGHAHDSGADGYTFGISAVVKSAGGRSIALVHSGHVGGTFTSGSRNHDWDETHPPSGLIGVNVGDFANAEFHTNLEYTSDIGEALEAALNWVVKFSVGTLLTPIGVVVFIGAEIGSLISTGSLVPGARVAGGVLWMAGPFNTLLALAAEGIASAGSVTRELTEEEYQWANDQVFQGSLPPRTDLVLTDTIGPGNRAFTFPRFDGKTTHNMGPAAFADPRRNGGNYGQTFIHELVHACQIHHTTMDLALLADALASKVCEITGDNPYVYPAAGFDYSDMNLEQQAQIVSDWYAGSKPPGTNQTGTPRDMASPYFRYITDNLRIGRF